MSFEKILNYGIAAMCILILVLWIFKCECGCWRGCVCSEGMCCCSSMSHRIIMSADGAVPEGFRVNKSRSVTLYQVGWCGVCKGFRPEWEKIKSNLASTGIAFSEINGDKARDPSIKSYPTIVMIDEWGNRHQLVGARPAEAVQRWITAPVPDQYLH